MPEGDGDKTEEKFKEEKLKKNQNLKEKINISNARILSHADIIKTCQKLAILLLQDVEQLLRQLPR